MIASYNKYIDLSTFCTVRMEEYYTCLPFNYLNCRHITFKARESILDVRI